jgi:hypothetical protein
MLTRGVNGRDRSVFGSCYEWDTLADFPLGGVVPGFQGAITGQTAGSTVAVAMTSADGYPEGQPRVGTQPGDTFVFAMKILSASSGAGAVHPTRRRSTACREEPNNRGAKRTVVAKTMTRCNRVLSKELPVSGG